MVANRLRLEDFMADRIGIFGGSFNPVHLGHLIMAECCLEQARLDRVLFVPASIPPHKQDQQLAPCSERIEMLRLATSGHERFAVCSDECDRSGVSYTLDTVTSLRKQFSEADLFLILGPDALASLPTWREPGRLASLVTILALERQGLDNLETVLQQPALRQLLPAGRAEQIWHERIRVPAIAIRASQIRDAVAAGRSIRFRTPRAVEQYIAQRGLYRP